MTRTEDILGKYKPCFWHNRHYVLDVCRDCFGHTKNCPEYLPVNSPQDSQQYSHFVPADTNVPKVLSNTMKNIRKSLENGVI